MRVFGFRVWNKTIDLMLYHTGLCMQHNVVGSSSPDELVIMQFTGLKDVSSQYIFEGDIYVRMTQWKTYVNNVNGNNKWYLNVVTWNEETAGFNLRAKNGYRVVGNIYENAELLNVKSKE